MSASLKILVVANPGDQAELVSLVRTAGSPLSEARLIQGVGDDATFARFAAERPTLALVGATLERGDSGALIASMRELAAPSPIFVILIGDARGPIQNALDALDIGADRFVGRPLTVKALRFAVVSGLGEAAGPWGGASSPAISVQALAAAALSSAPGDRRAMRVTTSTAVSPVGAPPAATGAAPGPAVDKAAAAAVREPLMLAREPMVARREPMVARREPMVGAREPIAREPMVGAREPIAREPMVGAPEPIARAPMLGAREPMVGAREPMVGAPEPIARAPMLGAREPAAVAEPVVAAVDEASVTMPMRVNELRARWEALAEEIDEIPDDELDDRPTLRHIDAAAPAAATIDAFDVDDGYSGEIQVLESPDDDESADGDVVAVAESEVVAELALGDDGEVIGGTNQAMQFDTFEPPPDDELRSAFEPMPVAADARLPEAESIPEPAYAHEPVAAFEQAYAFVAESEFESESESAPVATFEPVSPFYIPRSVTEVVVEPDVPAVIAVQETASVVAIPDSEAWPPPDLHGEDASPVVTSAPAPARQVEPPMPDLPVREPTMVLTDDPPPLAPAGPPPPSVLPPPVAPPPALLTTPRRSVTIPPPLPAVLRSPPPPAIDDDVPFADDFDVVEDDLGPGDSFGAGRFDRDGLDPLTDGGAAPTPVPAIASPGEPPPAGGEFARELRRKMSAMAERLFRGEVPAVPVASGPGHDHHTEIDLRGLDDEAPLPAAALTDDLGGATYVGELPTPEPHPSSPGTDGRGTSELGELRRGTADVPALVARMFAQTFTGRLVFRRGPVEKAIHFDGGRPVFATSNQLHDRMGELLHREGKITREQHDRCRDLVRDTGRRMGEILVDRGYLKRRELLPAVRRHVEDIIYSLFAWDAGEYKVVTGDGAGNERIRLSRHAAAIILEGVRRKLDHDLLEQLLGPPGTVVTIADRDKLTAVTAVADLSREERAALTALDGVADLDQVARASGAGLETVYQLAWSLSLLGLVAPRRRDEDGEGGALVGESDLRIDRERVRTRCDLCADADYFALLGVRRDATGFEIRRAYEAARRDFAPESFPPELRRELAADLDDIAQVLDEAYRVLRDDPLRSAYRGHLLDPTPDAG